MSFWPLFNYCSFFTFTTLANVNILHLFFVFVLCLHSQRQLHFFFLFLFVRHSQIFFFLVDLILSSDFSTFFLLKLWFFFDLLCSILYQFPMFYSHHPITTIHFFFSFDVISLLRLGFHIRSALIYLLIIDKCSISAFAD